MTEHLPECYWTINSQLEKYYCNGQAWPNCNCPCIQYDFGPCNVCVEQECICDALHACERRVWESASLQQDALIDIIRNDALDDAMEAVKMIHGSDMGVFDATAWIMKSAALKAIDALRNKT